MVPRSKLFSRVSPSTLTAPAQQQSSGTKQLVLRASPLLLAARRPHPLNTHVNDAIHAHPALQIHRLIPRHPHLRLAINPRQLRVDVIPAELGPLLRIPPAHFTRDAPIEPARAAAEREAVVMRAMRGVVGRDAEQSSLGAVGVRTSGASARGRRVVGAGGGGAGAGAGRGEPARVGEALGYEGAEGEDDDDRGLGERGGLKVVEDAELEAGEDDWGGWGQWLTVGVGVG